jgi:hypothetical protein
MGLIELMNVITDPEASRADRDSHKRWNTKVGEQTVDTCHTIDTGKFETAIERGDHWVVVEFYDSETEAESGHEAWVKHIKNRPDMPLADVYRDELGL